MGGWHTLPTHTAQAPAQAWPARAQHQTPAHGAAAGLRLPAQEQPARAPHSRSAHAGGQGGSSGSFPWGWILLGTASGLCGRATQRPPAAAAGGMTVTLQLVQRRPMWVAAADSASSFLQRSAAPQPTSCAWLAAIRSRQAAAAEAAAAVVAPAAARRALPSLSNSHQMCGHGAAAPALAMTRFIKAAASSPSLGGAARCCPRGAGAVRVAGRLGASAHLLIPCAAAPFCTGGLAAAGTRSSQRAGHIHAAGLRGGGGDWEGTFTSQGALEAARPRPPPLPFLFWLKPRLVAQGRGRALHCLPLRPCAGTAARTAVPPPASGACRRPRFQRRPALGSFAIPLARACAGAGS
jgi:hypothetical protein